MIGALDVIDRLPFELQARLEGDEFFADIPVVVAEAGDVKAEVERRQAVMRVKAGKWGVAVIVLQVLGDDDYPNVTFGPMALRPAFQVVELVEQNQGASGTGKSARRVARRIRDLVKSLGLAGVTTEFVPDRPCIEPVDLAADLGKLVRAYQVNFVTFEADTEEIIQVPAPVVTAVGGAVPRFSIACDDGAAAVWYSTDDGFPAPDRAGCVLYAGPVDVPAAGVVVRAAAYRAGCVASQVVRCSVSYGA